MHPYVAVLALALAYNAFASCPEKAVSLSELESKGITHSSRLQTEDVERENMVTILAADGAKLTLSFGYSNLDWKALRSRMQKGDYLASFSAKPTANNPLSGATGYLLIRGTCVIESFLTSIS